MASQGCNCYWWEHWGSVWLMTVCVTAQARPLAEDRGQEPHAMTVARSVSLAPRPASDTDTGVSTLAGRPGCTATCHTELRGKSRVNRIKGASTIQEKAFERQIQRNGLHSTHNTSQHFCQVRNRLFTWKVVSLQTFYWPCPAKQLFVYYDNDKIAFSFSARRVLKGSFPFLKMSVMILTRRWYRIKFSWQVLALAKAASIMTPAISVSPTKHSFGASLWITTKKSIHLLVRKNTFITYVESNYPMCFRFSSC